MDVRSLFDLGESSVQAQCVIPSLIFDLDGTLVDSLPGIADCLNRTLAAHELPTHPRDLVRGFVGNGLQVLIERAAPEADEQQVRALVEDFKRDYAHSWIEGTRPYPAVSAVLKELQRDGHQLAVLSNKTHPFTQTTVRELFPLIHFTLVVGQQDGMPHKPHPAGAFKIATAMGRNPRHCILIGDSVADVETAQHAEMPFIGVTWGYQSRIRLMEAGASTFVEGVSGLPRVIRELAQELD